MATACTSEETESLVTCSICLCEFDDTVRKPKFLPCAHTLCLKCLKEIHRDFVITCPLCRKVFSHQDDLSSLPNNPYVLHMLKLTAADPAIQHKSAHENKPSWCLTCGTMAKRGCLIIHSTIDVTVDTIKNFESLLKLKDDIKKLKDQSQTNLAMAVEKRQEIQVYLARLSLSLSMALNEVNQEEDQNNLRLVEMISQLEAGSSHLKSAGFSSNEDPLLAELISLVDDSKPEDSLETLKEKMEKSIESSRQKLDEATAMATEIRNQQTSKISVKLTDPDNKSVPTWGLLESGFNTCWPEGSSLTPTRQDFLLLSHFVFSIQKRGKNNYDDVEPETLKPALLPIPPKEVTTCNQLEKFDISTCKLIITVRRYGKLKGDVHIKLSPSCDSLFIQQLGKLCFKTPKQFSDMIGKAIGDVFLLVPVFDDFGTFSFEGLKILPPARHLQEVGISLWTDSKGKVGGWSFLFPLQHFESKQYQEHVKTMQPVYFIGQITKGLDIIDLLSWTTKNQRNGYTFSLESR